MEIFLVFIFILWIFFWSFASVVIDRLKNSKTWIFNWRSECPKCLHKLNFIDLIPIFWYILNKWKCRYCKEKISYIYPILEISMWFMFFLTTYLLIDIDKIFFLDYFEIWKMIFFLLFWFFTIVYVFYDILYLEIPDSILFILIFMSFLSIFLWYFNNNLLFFDTLRLENTYFNYDLYLVWLLFLIISSFYFIMLKWLKEIYDLIILFIIWVIIAFIQFYLKIDLTSSIVWSAILWSYFVFLFLFLQIFLSWWSWMWWGDLRIWILLWMIMWFSFSFQSVLISYTFWSVIWIIILLYFKTKTYYIYQKQIKKQVNNLLWDKDNISFDTKMAFWPFLAIWIYVVLFFQIFVEDIFKLNY